MWKDALVMNGTIWEKNSKEIDEEKLFKLLSENGFEFEGRYERIQLKEMEQTIGLIGEYITSDILKNMIEKLEAFYGLMTPDDIADFFSSNFGTGVFNGLFESFLSKELLVLYKKYANNDWQISDEFGSRVGDMISAKLVNL